MAQARALGTKQQNEIMATLFGGAIGANLARLARLARIWRDN
jgi:hypothetical protein